MHTRLFRLCISGAILSATAFGAVAADTPKRLVIVAGKPSHPKRQHEFNAGSLLLARCLRDVPGMATQVSLNGWPQDDAAFTDVDVLLSPVLTHTTPSLGHLSPTLGFDELFDRLQDYVGFTPLNNAAGGPEIGRAHV